MLSAFTGGIDRAQDEPAAGGLPDKQRAQARARRMRGFKDMRGKSLYLHGPLKDLGRGGVGVELYFRTLRWSGIVFLLVLVTGIFSLADNVGADSRLQDGSPLVRSTIGPTGRTVERLRRWQALPWFCMFLLVTSYMFWLRYKQRSIARSVDFRFITSGDFAVEVRAIPLHESKEAQLVTFFEQFGAVAHVQVGYKCAGYVLLLKRWQKLDIDQNEARARILQHEAENGAMSARHASRLSAIEAEMVQLEEQMAQMQRSDAVPTGAAFIIFDTEAGRRACLGALNPDAFKRLGAVFGISAGVPKYERFYQLDVVPAPEPSDVYWENLEVGPAAVRSRALGTLGAAAALIAISAVALTFFSQQKNREVERRAAEGGQGSSYYARALEIIAALVVTSTNGLLRLAIQAMTHYERRDTRSEYEVGLFIKLSLAYVVNQSCLIIFINTDTREWFVDGGVYPQAFFIALANAVVPELLKILRPEWLCRRCVLAPFAKSQSKLDELWSPPEASLGEYYAGLVKTLALALLFGPAMPVIYVITLLALAISYWATKYTMLRVCRQPPAMGPQLAEGFLTALSLLLLGSAILETVVLSAQLPRGTLPAERNRVLGFPIAALVLWLVYAFFPLQYIPCLRGYVDQASNDTGGKTFTSLRDQERYVCPISQPVPSIANSRNARVQVVAIADGSEHETSDANARQGRQPSMQALPQAVLRPQAQPMQAQAPPQPQLPVAVAEPAYPQPYQQHAPPPQPSYMSAVPSAYSPQAAMPMPPMLLSVTCPENVGPGAQLIVQGPTGQLVMVTVPNNVFPGTIFHVSV